MKYRLIILWFLVTCFGTANALEFYKHPTRKINGSYRFTVECSDGSKLTLNFFEGGPGAGLTNIFASKQLYSDLNRIKKFYLVIVYKDGTEKEHRLENYSDGLVARRTMIEGYHDSISRIDCNENPGQLDKSPSYSTHLEITGPQTATLFLNNKMNKWLKCSGHYFYRVSDQRTGQWQTNTSCSWDGSSYCGPINARKGLSQHRISFNQPWSIDRIQVLDFECFVSNTSLNK